MIRVSFRYKYIAINPERRPLSEIKKPPQMEAAF